MPNFPRKRRPVHRRREVSEFQRRYRQSNAGARFYHQSQFAGNTPDDWSFPGIPTYPGRDSAEGASGMASTFGNWRNQYGTSGGWVWLYDQVQGRTGTYAAAMNKVFGIATPR